MCSIIGPRVIVESVLITLNWIARRSLMLGALWICAISGPLKNAAAAS
jgi:hypothetical protein